MHDIAYRQLDDLAVLRAGNVRNLHDPRRDMAWARVLTNLAADVLLQGRVERTTFAQADEEHDAHVLVPLLRDGEALHHLVEFLDLAIDFGRADAHTARIQHGVRAAVDDQSIVFRQLDVIAVAPHASEALEIGGTVFRSVRIVPEAERHGRKRGSAHELPLLPAHRATVLVEDVDRQAEPAALDLAAPDRSHRITEHEARNDVGPTGDGSELNVVFNVRVYVVEAFGHQRRTRGENRLHRAEIVRARRFESELRGGVDVLRRRSEDGNLLRVGVVEKDASIAGEWRSV